MDSIDVTDATLKSFCIVSGEIQKSEERHREKFRSSESEPLNRLRICLDGLISKLYLEINDPIHPLTEEIEYQLYICASFEKTHFLLNDLILDGHLVEAHCLLRKQLEQLARLEELESLPIKKLYKKVPKIQHAIDGLGVKIYGELSKIVHFSVVDVGQMLLHTTAHGDHARVSIFSSYNKNSQYCMNLRLYLGLGFVRWLIPIVSKWYPSRDLTLIKNMFKICIITALEAGLFETPKNKHRAKKQKNMHKGFGKQ